MTQSWKARFLDNEDLIDLVQTYEDRGLWQNCDSESLIEHPFQALIKVRLKHFGMIPKALEETKSTFYVLNKM